MRIQISPIARMLVRPCAPTITWSCTVTFMCRPASTRSRVRRMSCWRRRRVAARVVVDDDQRGRAERDGAGDDFADMDRRFVDRALPQRLVGDQHVLGVEEQDAHFLGPPVRHCGVEIVAERVPARQHRLALDPRSPAAAARSLRRSSARRWSDRSALRGAACRRSRRAAARSRRSRASSRFASGLVSTRGMVSASRYSISS